MDETIDWLRGRPYYDGQLEAHRTLTGRDGDFADVDLEGRLESALESRGIDRLYRHQVAAVEAIRAGENVVVATPTASGKSLAYTVPAFERAMDHGGRTLYVAPQNALINDQEETLSELARDLGFGSRVSVEQYTGRLSKSEKRDVRDRRPTVVLTNPDMLHYALLPHAHRLWDWFFEGLETVVLDEVHEYRGVFGSHVALLLRRLRRVCDRFDADPEFVCCSATIGNPVEHAASVTGTDEDSFRLIDEDVSDTGPTHWLLWNPPEYENPQAGTSGQRRSNHAETKRLFADLVSKGHQTLTFTRARQAAEQWAMESADELRQRGRGDLAPDVTAYQAALGDDRRKEIEVGLRDGEVRGVWSTNALELGVDIGGLDAVLLDGYPGTRMAAFQQAGRAGRGTDPSLVALVAGEDQLDQYLMANPEEFFAGSPERAVVNPANDQLLPDHLLSAARETWLSPDDREYFGEAFPDLVNGLESEGLLEQRITHDGLRWTYDGDGSPQHEMSLRSIDDREVNLLDGRNGDTIASLSFEDALTDAHPGAIYHHQGQSYEVVDLDLSREVAELSPTWADYHTKVLHEKEITVEEDRREKRLETREDVPVRFADVTMRKQITGFERRDRSGETLARESLDLPEVSLRTKALYFTVPRDVESAMREQGDFAGGIHAAEHGMISLFPLELLCDRGDIGGLSTPMHPHTGRSTIFIYDGYPGGVGLVREGYETVADLMAQTAEMIGACDCESAGGCPACVQSPHCGNANDPLDEAQAKYLLDALTDGKAGEQEE
ncbi:DEAD/DEAH box helicase [Halorussus gelatinilyticus]|uniref:DEAD/DEAH box helicase n=1 Tax=Halorussus gelatinilyticus TaxID=2937524 RepID=A0A8U0IHF3_9EURY|nr:DEAD/DEAH box helicase [Halorussus gelatinilyticus]UPV99733.1 DEAD/DEAH box helicase [Halorussus gelatinilyticus]